jgi:hypothetical protein
MRTTLRNNQRWMATITTRYDIGGREMAEILVRFANVWGDYAPDLWEKTNSPGVEMTRGQVEEVVRGALRGWGSGAYRGPDEDEGSESLTEEQVYTRATWPTAQVARVYPELDDAELRDFHDEHLRAAEERRKYEEESK